MHILGLILAVGLTLVVTAYLACFVVGFICARRRSPTEAIKVGLKLGPYLVLMLINNHLCYSWPMPSEERRNKVTIKRQKMIIIIGASSGIGQACALHFAAQGWVVIAAARRLERLISLREQNSNIKIRVCDVTKERSVKALFSAAKTSGRIDAVLYSAGAGFATDTSLNQTNFQKFKVAFQTNVEGTAYAAAAAQTIFESQKHGLFVGIGSRASLYFDVLGGRVVYSATKHGQLGVIVTLGVELAGNGTARAIAVCPGLIPGTEMVAGIDQENVGLGTPLVVAVKLFYQLIDKPENFPQTIYILDESRLKAVEPAQVD